MAEEIFAPQRLYEAMNGMSNIELAEKLGCSRSNITMYLSGMRKPSKMTIQLISLYLGVNPAWLMGLSDEKYVRKPDSGRSDGLLLDPLNRRFLELFSQLTPEQKDLMLAQVKGILLNQ